MGTRIHLYALPGLPLHVEDLMPQPLLARCASALFAEGHAALILDGGTLESLDVPETDALASALAYRGRSTANTFTRLCSALTRRAHGLEPLLEHCRLARAARLLETAGTHEAPAAVLIQIQRRKDVPAARLLARQLRTRYPRVCVSIAGEFVNRYARSLLAGAPEFDLACLGPAETVLAALVRSLPDRSGWRTVPGLVLRDSRRLFTGPPRGPAPPVMTHSRGYHPAAYPALMDGGKFKLFVLSQGSGPGHAGHHRGEWEYCPVQARDARELRGEIMHLHDLYGALTFHISGRDVPADAALEFAAEAASLPFSIGYSREVNVLDLDAPFVATAFGSGCRALGTPLLTGSQHLLTDYYGEPWTISHVERGARNCREQGLLFHGEFVFPCPADDYHTRAETMRLLRRCAPDSVRFRLPELVPGSAWRQHAADFGFQVAPAKLERWVTEPDFSASIFDDASQLPYTMNGLRGTALLERLHDLYAELEEIGIARASCVQSGLMAHVSGFEGREGRFAQALDGALRSLDLPRLHDTIDAFNARATASINTLDVYPPIPMKKAVGD